MPQVVKVQVGNANRGAARDEDGGVLEVSESIWAADRVILIDDYPIEQQPEEPTAASEI